MVRSPSVLTISGCINTGKISAKGNIGGISGYSRSTISCCYNTGDLSNTLLDDKGDGYNAMGGIASRSGMPITDCFNLGNLYTQTMDPPGASLLQRRYFRDCRCGFPHPY
ncbi:hypothetical protein [Eubacterium aggregans]|uniref:hypothetical protein n=1 Tax=Eubacterium aggregans TaxID=81409 RepID=UPI003F31342B